MYQEAEDTNGLASSKGNQCTFEHHFQPLADNPKRDLYKSTSSVLIQASIEGKV